VLARELEAAITMIEYVPQAGRRIKSRFFSDVRRLLLRQTGHHLFYQASDPTRQVRIVYLRHAERRPLIKPRSR
jgi:plasmid stabilization system protein ParE